MNDLSQCVHTGIGTSAGGRNRAAPRQPIKRVFEDFLDRSQPILALPAVKVGAVIGKGQLDVTHREGSKNHRRPGSHTTGTAGTSSRSFSAICTAFVAAPFRRLSLTHQKSSELGR